MHVYTETVSETVLEISSVAVSLYYLARKHISVAAEHTALDVFESVGLSAQHNLVNLTHFFVRLAAENRPSHVGAVTVVPGTEVHRHCVAESYFFVSGMRVGLAAVLSRRDNSVESKTARSVFAHLIFQLNRNVQFRHVRLNEIEDVFERFVGNFLRFSNKLDFVVGLETSLHEYSVSNGNKLKPHKLFAKPRIFGIRDFCILEADGFYVVLL